MRASVSQNLTYNIPTYVRLYGPNHKCNELMRQVLVVFGQPQIQPPLLKQS